jgi:hypothetical protein
VVGLGVEVACAIAEFSQVRRDGASDFDTANANNNSSV